MAELQTEEQTKSTESEATTIDVEAYLAANRAESAETSGDVEGGTLQTSSNVDFARVSILDPDFLLYAAPLAIIADLFTIIVNIFDFLVVPGIINMIIQALLFFTLGRWIAKRTGKIVEAKEKEKLEKNLQKAKQELQKVQKLNNMSPEARQRYARRYRKQMGKATKGLQKLSKTVAGKFLVRNGLTVLEESIPLVGVIPWWTIRVFSTLTKK